MCGRDYFHIRFQDFLFDVIESSSLTCACVTDMCHDAREPDAQAASSTAPRAAAASPLSRNTHTYVNFIYLRSTTTFTCHMCIHAAPRAPAPEDGRASNATEERRSCPPRARALLSETRPALRLPTVVRARAPRRSFSPKANLRVQRNTEWYTRTHTHGAAPRAVPQLGMDRPRARLPSGGSYPSAAAAWVTLPHIRSTCRFVVHAFSSTRQ